MPSYLHPDVYVEETAEAAGPIAGAATSTACFIGYAGKGAVQEPTLIGQWDDYDNQFGGFVDDVDPRKIAMGHALSVFYKNGGGSAYIIRLSGKGASMAEGGCPSLTDYQSAFSLLTNCRDINIICLPGQWWGDAGMDMEAYRKDVVINVMNWQGQVVISYRLFRARVSADQAFPDVDAGSSNAVSIRTIVLECEGWARDTAVSEPAED